MRRGWWLPGFSERLRGWGNNDEGAEWEWNEAGPEAVAGEAVGEDRGGAAAEGRAGEAGGAGAGSEAGATCSSEPYEGLARRLNDFAPRSSADVPTPEDAGRNLLRVSRDFAATRRFPAVQPPCVSDISLSDSSEFCRICRDSGGREPLIAPCDCRGTVRFVHKSCLERWLAESDTSFCEICGLRYVTERTPRYSLLKSVFLWALASRRELLMDVMTFLTFMPLAVLGTTMGMTASRSLCYGLLSEPNDDGVSNLVLLVEPQLGPVAAQVCAGLACAGAQTLTAAVVAVMAAMDIAVSTWLVLRVQQHAARCYAWWRRHCVVRLVLSPHDADAATTTTTAAAAVEDERGRERDGSHDDAPPAADCGQLMRLAGSQRNEGRRRASTHEAPESALSYTPTKSPSSLAATAAARLATMATETVVMQSANISIDVTFTPRSTESASSDSPCSSETGWDTSTATTENTDVSFDKTPSRKHVTRGTMTEPRTISCHIKSVPCENPVCKAMSPSMSPETRARGFLDSKSDNVFNGEDAVSSKIVFNMKPSVLSKSVSGGPCAVKSGNALSCKPGTTLLRKSDEGKSGRDSTSSSEQNVDSRVVQRGRYGLGGASQGRSSSHREKERVVGHSVSRTSHNRQLSRSQGSTSYKAFPKPEK